MAPTYKLTYFNLIALGEPVRFFLCYGGVDWEDNRIEREQWPAMKGDVPFGQLPLLEVEGKKVAQSTSICRFLGKKFGLDGRDEWENLEIDALVDTIVDFRSKVQDYFYDPDPASKDKKKGPLFNEIIPYYIPKLEELAKKNNGYLFNGKLTWADIYLVAILDYINAMLGFDLIEKTPNLKALQDKVRAIPSIKAWLQKRPPTPY